MLQVLIASWWLCPDVLLERSADSEHGKWVPLKV
jgi:hypothetical protein